MATLRPRLELAIFRLQSECSNHSATTTGVEIEKISIYKLISHGDLYFSS